MAGLRPASRRVIAEIASTMKHDHIVAEFEKLDLIDDQQAYNDIMDGMEGGISFQGKEAQLKAMLDWVAEDDETEKKLIPLASNLVSKALGRGSSGRDEVKRLNLFLMGDGKSYNPGTGTITNAVGNVKVERKLSAELDRRLARIDEKFVEMHNGIWDALASTSRDKERQAISSSRELLSHVLRDLTKDLDKTKKKGDVITRKQRVKHILRSETNSEFVDSVADAIENIYAVGSSGTHAESDYDTIVVAAKMTEYTLLLILRRAHTS
jgi:hypothetical protein